MTTKSWFRPLQKQVLDCNLIRRFYNLCLSFPCLGAGVAVSGFRVLLNSGSLPRDHNNNHNLDGIWKFVRGIDLRMSPSAIVRIRIIRMSKMNAAQSNLLEIKAQVNNAGAPWPSFCDTGALVAFNVLWECDVPKQSRRVGERSNELLKKLPIFMHPLIPVKYTLLNNQV